MDESSKQLTKEVREPLLMQPKLVEDAQKVKLDKTKETHPTIISKEVEQHLSMRPGQVERYDTEYERNGTASIFMAFEPRCTSGIWTEPKLRG